jgi:hypothetical protein
MRAACRADDARILTGFGRRHSGAWQELQRSAALIEANSCAGGLDLIALVALTGGPRLNAVPLSQNNHDPPAADWWQNRRSIS